MSIANVYDRVLHETSQYTGLRGTVSLEEQLSDGTIRLTGSFATNLQDYAGHTSDLKLQAGLVPPTVLAVRAIDRTIYFRMGAGPWQNLTQPSAGSDTQQVASRRDLFAQLLAGLDPLEYADLLSAPQNLKESPVGAGAKGFTGTVDVDHTASATSQYSFTLAQSYLDEGLTSKTFTATFDSQARPITLHEHLASAKLTIDYHVTITGYSAAKVSAPS
ncbi:MAG: hypothetical protein M3Y77_10585 [Actinomycetota bacterium]|nr:hypothetical protein [Actinomycetota bacterium]MDQ2846773.1 hypothetical protein [Actinomycetota bacterium]MDQ2958210.1 hypothetical protein [Actinomycetota bacterium]